VNANRKTKFSTNNLEHNNKSHTFLKVLSMSSNFFASSGSWERMSPPMKMLSRYIHFLWTTSQTYGITMNKK